MRFRERHVQTIKDQPDLHAGVFQRYVRVRDQAVGGEEALIPERCSRPSVLSFVMVVSFPASYSRDGTKTSVSKPVSNSTVCYYQSKTILLKSSAKQKMLDTITMIYLRMAPTVPAIPKRS